MSPVPFPDERKPSLYNQRIEKERAVSEEEIDARMLWVPESLRVRFRKV